MDKIKLHTYIVFMARRASACRSKWLLVAAPADQNSLKGMCHDPQEEQSWKTIDENGRVSGIVTLILGAAACPGSTMYCFPHHDQQHEETKLGGCDRLAENIVYFDLRVPLVSTLKKGSF